MGVKAVWTIIIIPDQSSVVCVVYCTLTTVELTVHPLTHLHRKAYIQAYCVAVKSATKIQRSKSLIWGRGGGGRSVTRYQKEPTSEERLLETTFTATERAQQRPAETGKQSPTLAEARVGRILPALPPVTPAHHPSDTAENVRLLE